jgi:hypothetical protein
MFRHWRIQVSIICFTLFLAVIMFWVRSYTWDDQVTLTYKGTSCFRAVSINGNVYFGSTIFPAGRTTAVLGWQMTSSQVIPEIKDDLWSSLKNKSGIDFLGFHVFVSNTVTLVSIPYWFISIVFALLCGVPWYWRRFNFSLRTFFIAFTVLAVVLGAAVWLLR